MGIKIHSAEQYAEHLCLEADETMTEGRTEALDEIISLEAAIYAMRRCAGIDGFNIDNVRNLRDAKVRYYNAVYPKYVSCNDYED